ncbi:uncharacterized protein LOC135687817 [Rhopilema esculentum]|uniref:uncharacterized protein LOC135687817 n=1 Tax=Rhopilema esculentum TaxID=499914 RepID=UPI0031E3CB98
MKAVYDMMGSQDYKEDKMCGSSYWQAARSKAKTGFATLDETGLVVAGCRHVIALKAVNMFAGEQYGYALYLHKELMSNFNIQFFWQDIMGKYWPWLEKVSTRTPELSHLLSMSTALSVMHAKAHSLDCQIVWEGLYQEKAALSTGESMEQFFSCLAKCGLTTKNMNAAARIDSLTEHTAFWNRRKIDNLAFSLSKQYKKKQEEGAKNHKEGEDILSPSRVHKPSQDEKEEGAKANSADQCTTELDASNTTELPLPKRESHLSFASNCRDMLHKIKGLAYLITDVNAMSALEDNLETILEELTESADKENGFLLERKDVRNKVGKKRSRQRAKTSRFLAKLPVEPKRQRKRRYGEGYETWLASRTLDVKEEGGKFSKIRKIQSSKGLPDGKVARDELLETDILIQKSEEHPVDSTANAYQLIESSDEDDKINENWISISSLQLTKEDKEIMQFSDMWLNDRIINAVQFILKKQFPLIEGFQDTLLQKKHQFKVMSGEFVQIINKSGNHWMTLSTLGINHQGSIKIFDSMNSKVLNQEIKGIIASVIMTKNRVIHVKVENVQQQPDSYNCGLFAIAFATHLCFHQNPRCLQFDVSKMRNHLFKCLEAKRLGPFPLSGIHKNEHLGSLHVFRVYCICRMPIDNEDIMQTCNVCSEKFHRYCQQKSNVIMTCGIAVSAGNFYSSECFKDIGTQAG